MALGDVTGNGEAEARVRLVLIAGVVDAVERLEDVISLGFGDARPVVVDLNPEPWSFRGGADQHLIAIAYSVGDEIGDGALERVALQRNHDIEVLPP